MLKLFPWLGCHLIKGYFILKSYNINSAFFLLNENEVKNANQHCQLLEIEVLGLVSSRDYNI